jgi:hypothetical protein
MTEIFTVEIILTTAIVGNSALVTIMGFLMMREHWVCGRPCRQRGCRAITWSPPFHERLQGRIESLEGLGEELLFVGKEIVGTNPAMTAYPRESFTRYGRDTGGTHWEGPPPVA